MILLCPHFSAELRAGRRTLPGSISLHSLRSTLDVIAVQVRKHVPPRQHRVVSLRNKTSFLAPDGSGKDVQRIANRMPRMSLQIPSSERVLALWQLCHGNLRFSRRRVVWKPENLQDLLV